MRNQICPVPSDTIHDVARSTNQTQPDSSPGIKLLLGIESKGSYAVVDERKCHQTFYCMSGCHRLAGSDVKQKEKNQIHKIQMQSRDHHNQVP